MKKFGTAILIAIAICLCVATYAWACYRVVNTYDGSRVIQYSIKCNNGNSGVIYYEKYRSGPKYKSSAFGAFYYSLDEAARARCGCD